MPRLGRPSAIRPGALLLAGALAAASSLRCGARSDLGASDAGAAPTGTVPVTPPGSAPGAPPPGTPPPGTTPACSDAVLGTDPTGAAGLAAVGTDVYWSTFDGRLMKSALDAPGQPLAAGLLYPSDVAVFGGTVFFADQTRILSIPTTGGAMTVIATKQSSPIAIVADAGGVWWLNYGNGILAGSVVASIGGGPPQTIIDQIDTPSDLAMDGTHLYFAAAMAKVNGKIEMGPLVRIAKSTGAAELLSFDLHQPAGMALDAAHLYWLERVNSSSSFPGRLRGSPKNGGAPPVDLASTQDVLTVRVVVDDRFAYVTGLQGTGAAAHGVLWRVALAGGAVTEVARTDDTSYEAVAVTDAAVYWTIGWTKGAQPAGAPSVRKICKRW